MHRPPPSPNSPDQTGREDTDEGSPRGPAERIEGSVEPPHAIPPATPTSPRQTLEAAEEAIVAGQRQQRRSCPICRATARLWRVVRRIPILHCGKCGHRFARLRSSEGHVAKIYDDSYFFGGGAGYSDYLSEEGLLRQRGRWYAQIVERQMRPGRVLDVGAAAGFTLAGFCESGWQGAGIEPNATMARHARDVLGLDVQTCELGAFTSRDAESHEAGLDPGPEGFDLVLLLQVVAHLNDPHTSLGTIAQLVRRGGYCLIETWNRASLPALLLGKHWHEYSPPSVLHWYTPHSLDRLLDAHGFAVASTGRPRKRIRGDHAKSLLAHSAAESRLASVASTMARWIPDAAEIPYPSWDLCWRLYRRR